MLPHGLKMTHLFCSIVNNLGVLPVLVWRRTRYMSLTKPMMTQYDTSTEKLEGLDSLTTLSSLWRKFRCLRRRWFYWDGTLDPNSCHHTHYRTVTMIHKGNMVLKVYISAKSEYLRIISEDYMRISNHTHIHLITNSLIAAPVNWIKNISFWK